MKYIFLIAILAVLTSCSTSLASEEVQADQMTPTPADQSTESIIPTVSPSVSPVMPTPRAVLLSPTPELIMSTPAAETYLETINISSFISAWNSADVGAIRSFYTADARYYPEAEMQNLYRGQPTDVLVSDPSFAKQVAHYEGMTLRILDQPMMIYDKLVAFLYRCENNTNGYDGAALLRYENGKIFLHSFIEFGQLTPNPLDGSSYVREVNLDDLMQAWNDSDLVAAQDIYSEEAVILSDEDLAQAAWRDFPVPPKIDQLLTQFAGWNPTILGTPKRIGNLVIFAWHWQAFDYPKGYGIRMMHIQDSKVATDIRYAIRPWEANGKPFMVP